MTEHKQDLAFFVELETRVWNALMRGDTAADESLLASSFLGVYGSGFASKQEHVRQLENGPTVESFSIEIPRLMELGPSIAVLSYRVLWSRPSNGQLQNKATMYVTSIWQKLGDVWLNVFSQDTPAQSDV
jgi:hypothetical protein